MISCFPILGKMHLRSDLSSLWMMFWKPFVLDELMLALRSQNIDIDAKEEDYLVLYRSANREKAIDIGKKIRAEHGSVRLMRKKADLPLEFYKEYGKRSEVATLIYIDDTGEVSEFQINE